MRDGTYEADDSRLAIAGLSDDRWLIAGHIGHLTIPSQPMTRESAQQHLRLFVPELADQIIGTDR